MYTTLWIHASRPLDESMNYNQVGKEVKGRAHTYYQVLIDSRDCPYIVSFMYWIDYFFLKWLITYIMKILIIDMYFEISILRFSLIKCGIVQGYCQELFIVVIFLFYQRMEHRSCILNMMRYYKLSLILSFDRPSSCLIDFLYLFFCIRELRLRLLRSWATKTMEGHYMLCLAWTT